MKKKFKTKLFMSKKIHRALTAGVLACILSCGAVMPNANALGYPIVTPGYITWSYAVNFVVDENNKTVTGVQFARDTENDSVFTDVYTFNTGSSGSGETTYTAGNGITISSDNKVYV